MALQVVLHFKDGATGVIAGGAKCAPFPGDEEFFQVLDNSSPGVPIAFVPVENCEYAAYES